MTYAALDTIRRAERVLDEYVDDVSNDPVAALDRLLVIREKLARARVHASRLDLSEKEHRRAEETWLDWSHTHAKERRRFIETHLRGRGSP